MSKSDIEEIYFAGGCLWGVQEFVRHLPGVVRTEAGRANGSGDDLDGDYDGYAECVRIWFDPSQVTVKELMACFFEIIDPHSLNQQGPDVGKKYRTGIYSRDPDHLRKARDFIAEMTDRDRVVVEVLPLSNFVRSAEEHQDRLQKHPEDSCHIPKSLLHKYRAEPTTVPTIRRWVVLIAGVILQTAIGGIYAWSTFVPTLVDQHGLSRGETGILFGIQVLVFSVATIPAGKLLSRFGPRRTAVGGAVLFGLGYVLASTTGNSFWGLFLSLGLVTGTGIGLVYVCPLTTGMKWFPHHKGIVTGTAVAGFGLGAIFLSQVAEYLLSAKGMSVHEIFRWVGMVFGGFAVLSALCLSNPPHGSLGSGQRTKSKLLIHFRSSIFIVLAFGMFAGTFAGLLVSAHLKPFLLFQGATEALAVLAISFFAVGNASGRLIWGWIHDRIGSRPAVLLSLGCGLLSLLLLTVLAFLQTPALAGPLVVLTGFGFGACFVIYVSAITAIFGVQRMPRLYPVCFVGYGFAAVIGPAVGGWMVDGFGSYVPAFLLSAVLLAIAIAGVGLLDRRKWTPVV